MGSVENVTLQIVTTVSVSWRYATWGRGVNNMDIGELAPSISGTDPRKPQSL